MITKSILTFMMIVCLISQPLVSAYAGQEGNGGSVFEIGEATVVWDFAEYGNPFHPTITSGWPILSSQLDRLKQKLPKSGHYISSLFENGPLMWWLVTPPLKPISDNSGSHLILTYKSQQIAINSHNLIQVYESLWNELKDSSKAYLMMHEAGWSLLEHKTTDGQLVRALTGVLMNPYIDIMSNSSLAKMILDLVSNIDTRFSRLIARDAGKVLVHSHDSKFIDFRIYIDCKIEFVRIGGDYEPGLRATVWGINKDNTKYRLWFKPNVSLNPGRPIEVLEQLKDEGVCPKYSSVTPVDEYPKKNKKRR